MEHSPTMAEELDVSINNNAYKPKATKAKTSDIYASMSRVQTIDPPAKVKASGRQQVSQDQKELDALWDYINEIFGGEFNGPVIGSQIKDYHEKRGWAYRSIHKTLLYYYKIRGHRPLYGESNTIGIVPYVINDASKYYKALAAMKETNNNAVAILKTVESTEVKINIPTPEYTGSIKRRKATFSFLDEDGVNE